MISKKLKSVAFSNHKKQLFIQYASGKQITVHYGQIGIKKNILQTWVDDETGKKSIGIRYLDGTVDYMPYDQPLVAVGDPLFRLQNHIELLTAHIKSEIKKQKVSKRFLAHELGTSVNQVQRLLNPKIVNKNLEQLYRMAAALRLEVEVTLKKVA